MKFSRTPFVVFAVMFLAASSRAQDTTNRSVYVRGQYGSGMRPGVAVLPIAGTSGDSVRAIVQRDLDYSDRVTIAGQNAEDLPLVAGVPTTAAYDIFGKMGLTFVVQGSFTPNGALHVALYNIPQKAIVNTTNFDLNKTPLSGDWRMDLHRASDVIESWITGAPGIAASRIAFTRSGQIWTVDSDGWNAAPVEGTRLGRSPSWSPSTQFLAFSTDPDKDAGGISIRDLWAGSTRRITPSTASGSYSAPVFSPDGATIAYGFGTAGIDIFTIDAKGGQPKNVTVGRNSLNTSPTFSRDGRQIAFTSGRLGPPDVYIADIDGSNAHQLTDEGFSLDKTYRTNPSWSPDGLRIAYQSRVNDRDQIVISPPGGRGTQSLTSEGENEDPYWASDSRHLVFTSTRGGGPKQLWVLDTQSGRVRQLTRGAEVKNPAWSSPLPRR